MHQEKKLEITYRDCSMSYSREMKRHLGDYKEKNMPGLPNGTWRSIEYPHILPPTEYKQNILPAFRDEFWSWFDKQQPKIKLHQDFHHLNSSQAMCFNLFFPFLANDNQLIPKLLTILGLPEQTGTPAFEKILLPGENTNFDFYLEHGNDQNLFFELKLTESGFGTADKENREKYEPKITRYHQGLSALIDPKWMAYEKFLEHYQILRNISYVARYPRSRLFFIFPKANETLRKGESAIREIVGLALKDRVTVFYLEELIAEIILLAEQVGGQFQEHFREFRVKYAV
jgi:hypothetical protein